MAKKTGVYKIVNIVNNKVYVGSSCDINRRWKEHIFRLKKNKHHSVKLQNSFNKYGVDVFIFEVIEECEKNQLIIKEQYWIDSLNSCNHGYNHKTKSGITLGFLGKKHSEYFKIKKSEEMLDNKFALGLKHSEEYKLYMKSINTGVNNPNYGKKQSLECIKKRLETVKKNNSFKGENNPNFKFTINYEDLKNLFLIENKTLKEIAKIYNCSVGTITNNLRKYNLNKPKSNKYNLNVKDIFSYREKGLTFNEIGKIYGCSGKKINRYVKKHRHEK